MPNPIAHRYDFVYLFDCLDGNPNGDPDAANQPRIDPQTLHGLVSDVCIKRKVRNYIHTLDRQENDIFVQHRSPLNPRIKEACEKSGVKTHEKPGGGYDTQEAKKRSPSEIRLVQDYLTKRYYDIRAFGGVLSSGPNAGQVRGPIQITFSRSIDPVTVLDLGITRIADTDKDTEGEMGRKNLIPYGLYRCHGFISAHLAAQTGFSGEDLGLLWEALKVMFDHDRSAARGTMAARKLVAFKHVGTESDAGKRATQAKLGCAPAHKLFDLVEVKRRDGVAAARSYGDYAVSSPAAGPLAAFPGVEVEELL